MNPKDFETGQDIIRALQSANASIGGVLNNLTEHPGRLRGAGANQSLDETVAIGQANAIQKLAEKLAKAESSLEFCREWYSCRFERLSQFIREEIPEPQKTRYFSIIANGAADHMEPNTYAYQMNVRRYELEAATKEVAKLREALGLDGPWPLVDVLLSLRSAALHLLHSHSCDCQGHETISCNVDRAQDYADRIQKAIAPK